MTYPHTSGEPDDSPEAHARRLGAIRGAIRARNPETGERHHLHKPLFRAAAIKYVRELRRLVRENP